MANQARNQLRAMGGIMASSPELMQAYQDGGPVRLTLGQLLGLSSPPAAPQQPIPSIVTADPRVRESEEFRERVLGAGNRPVDAAFEGLQRGGEYLVEGPLSDVASLGPRGISGIYNVLGGGASLLGADTLASGLEARSDQAYNRAKTLSQAGYSALDEIDQADYNLEPEQFTEVAERARRDMAVEKAMREDPGDDARAAATRAALEDLSPPDPDELKEESGTVDTTDEDRAAATRAALEDLPPPPDPDDNTPKARRTLRERYNRQIELYKDLFGESDEARARDRAMSLAMLGLAIASGQSPNALTNIAQGAMAGVQGMSDQEQARRDREEGIKTMALQTAIDQMSAADRAEAEAAESQLEFERDVVLKRLGQGGAGVRDARSIVDFAQNVYNTSLDAAQQGIATDFQPDQETPEQYAARMSQNAMQRFAPLYGGESTLGGAQTPAVTPAQRVKELREQGVPDEQIKQGFQASFPDLDPADYGL